MGHNATEKLVFRNADLAQKARTADAAARALAKDCDRRITKAKKALNDIALECEAADHVEGDVALFKKSFAAVAKAARKAIRQL